MEGQRRTPWNLRVVGAPDPGERQERTPTFAAARFTEPKARPRMNEQQNAVHAHAAVSLGHKKEGNSDSHYSADGPEDTLLGERSRTQGAAQCVIPLV